MPVDHLDLLEWITKREALEPGVPLDGHNLMQQASGLAGGDGLPWPAVARATGQLRRLGFIEWNYKLWKHEEGREPDAELISENNLHKASDIVVTGEGHAALANRARVGAPQVNIVNSTVGQLAMGNIANVNLLTILDGAEKALDDVDGSPVEKEEARSVIQRMREVGAPIATSAAAGVLGAAVRHALGLP